MNTKHHVDLAIQLLNAEKMPDGRWRYQAYETNSWWVVALEDIELLGRRLARNESDAYSLWCSYTDAEEVDDPEDLLACVHCGYEVRKDALPDAVFPPVDDDAAWTALAKHHAATCEWWKSRGQHIAF